MRTLIKKISAIFNKIIGKIAELMQKLRLNY